MYDFEGWATKNDLRCADGLTIRKDAFRGNDGKKVPLIWNHHHGTVGSVLGHAILENREEGVWAKCSFNNTSAGKDAKESVLHGDVTSLSIWANNVQQIGKDVIHGVIREVSLVLAGANPGAFIESVVEHGMPFIDGEEEGIFYTGEEGLIISHADDPEDKKEKEPESEKKDNKSEGKTIKDVIDTMNEDQKKAMAVLVGQAISDTKAQYEKGEKKEEKEVKHNLFEGRSSRGTVISHSDMEEILKTAKSTGSLKEAVKYHVNDGVLKHAIPTEGMETAEGSSTYGFNDPEMLFPDYKALNETPEWLSRNMDWVPKFMAKVHHTPFSRIKSMFADITEDEARAKGYMKTKLKKDEVFSLLKRTTDPQTIYKRQKMDRDDVIDITSFDVIAWIKAEMRVMLNEEIARACLIGDGRLNSSDDKIKEDHVRPIVTDAPLFNTVIKVKVPANADEGMIASETIKAIIRGRKRYKGTGRPDFWTTDDVVTEMLLLENKIGDPIYKTEGELSTKLRVNEIIPVEVMEEQEVTFEGKQYPLIGVIVNIVDYNIGANKGGEISMFDDFDIDYNQQKYLIETRISGALIKPFSALTIVLDKSDE